MFMLHVNEQTKMFKPRSDEEHTITGLNGTIAIINHIHIKKNFNTGKIFSKTSFEQSAETTRGWRESIK